MKPTPRVAALLVLALLVAPMAESTAGAAVPLAQAPSAAGLAALDARMRAEVVSALNASIQDVFNENGVQIMSPHYLGDPAEAKVVPRSRWFAPPAKGG